MMIEKHIAALLYRFQCVTLPGFGAFISELESAKVAGSASTFNPPKKKITFNPNVKNNDGLLANHIALQENISFEKASEVIAFQVSKWITSLEQREKVVLAKIGEISTNADLNWVFEPYEDVNYLTSSFGLTSFVSPLITREQLKTQVEELEEKAPIIFTPERKNNYSFVKYAASIVLFLGLGTVGYKMYNDQQVANQTLFVEKQVQEKVNHKIQEATFFISNPLSTVELPVKEELKPYHIVAGAFRNEENAQTTLNNLKEKGFSARLLEKNKSGLIPVAYESYSSLEEAQLAKQKIQTEQNTEAWLLIE
ncbi:SPOR domain-containing protein [Flavobacterium sp. N2270]|uniref:HU domain-containing protein n=1 Tax=Flavobacterium sp. N2270 TaxID=2986831 RepID=UPI002225A066|nr:SPOR domain-containing protein [Flavobacterium sp. N2270]